MGSDGDIVKIVVEGKLAVTNDTKLYQEGLEEYPVSAVLVENVFMFLWIAVGTFLCWIFLPIVAWIYLLFGLIMVLWVMRILVCKSCYYHGKRCHTGWGKLSAIYCQQGELGDFGSGIGGAIIPIFYGSMVLLPLILGVISIIQGSSLLKISMVLTFLFIAIMSSVVLRKKTCAVCKMKHICPGCAAK
jgi:hypothetical protein